jgi:hypothetical protein
VQVRGLALSALRTLKCDPPSELGPAIARCEIHTEHRACATHRGYDWLKLIGLAHLSMTPRAGHAHGN